MLGPAQLLRAAGYSTLLIDFQATGESPGEAITFGWHERLDVIAAVAWLRESAPNEPIGILGRSLGGAATILAGSRLEVQAAVLEAVYPSIEAAVDNRLRIRLGSVGPWLSPLLLAQLPPRLGVRPADLRPVEHIGELRCPVLLIAGTADEHTTVGDTRQLFVAARQPKELWLIAGANHAGYERIAGDLYAQRLLTFFNRNLRGD